LANWQERFVSSYASAHPWEDFAETWAHYLHMVDTLKSANAFGLRIRPAAGRDPALAIEIDFDPYRQEDFDLPLTHAINSLNSSMGRISTLSFWPWRSWESCASSMGLSIRAAGNT
jgi:hypothetical protein